MLGEDLDPSLFPRRETDTTSKQHKAISKYHNDRKSLKAVRSEELLERVIERIELSDGSKSDIREIMTVLIRYRSEHVCKDYWVAWRRLLERNPDIAIAPSEIGIDTTSKSNTLEAVCEKERESYCEEIIEKFKSIRVLEEPKLPKPKNPDPSTFYTIKVPDPYKGRFFEDESVQLTLFKWEVNAYTHKDPAFQTKLGDYYFSTWPEMTRWWYTKASILKYPEATFRRGFCYEFGHAIDEQNFEKAKELYAIAAADGCTSALNSLGAILRRINPNLAFDFFAESAIRGDLDAMCNLGLSCLTGQGVTQSESNAISFFSAAAEWGHAASLHHLGNCAALGLHLPPQLSLAVRYWSLAAEKGCYESAFNVAKCFYDGVCLPKNRTAAFKWFSYAAQHNQPFAMYWKGLCYKLGHGVEQDIPKSLEIFTKAARLGRYLQPDLQILLYGALQDQNFDVGFLAEEEAEVASW